MEAHLTSRVERPDQTCSLFVAPGCGGAEPASAGCSTPWMSTPLLTDAGGLDTLLTSAFGSGDPRQLDGGVGGGSSTTSKAAIVRRSQLPGIDIDYLFAQVAIGDRRVEWGSNCGNCATAIGLYALQSGLVAVHDTTTEIRMRNENTGASSPRRSPPPAAG